MTKAQTVQATRDVAVTSLAAKLRRLRREHGHSLEEVSKGTGISTSFLSLIENEKSDITVSRLIRLLSFYGTTISDLFPAPVHEPDPVLVRESEAVLIRSPSEGIEVYLLAPDTKRAMLPMVSFFEPGKGLADANHHGEEFIHVLQGTFELTLDDATELRLRRGDSAYYDAAHAVSLRNVSRVTGKLFAVVCPPTF